MAERLDGCLSNADDMRTLRRIAAQDDPMTLRLDDGQVLAHVAALIARRALCALGSVLTRPPSFAREDGFGDRPTGTPAARPAVTATRAPDVAPVRVRTRPAAEPVAPVPDIADMAETVDGAQQAAVLKDAARDGIPFCEVCEKARREREAQHAATG